MGLRRTIWHLWIRSKCCTYFVKETGMSKVYCLVDCVQLKLLPVVWNSSLFSSLDQNQLEHAVCKNTPLNSLQQSNKKESRTALSELKVVIAYASNRAPAFTGSGIIRRDGAGRLDESCRRLIKRTSHLYSHQVTIHCCSPPATSLYLLGFRSIFCNYNTS